MLAPQLPLVDRAAGLALRPWRADDAPALAAAWADPEVSRHTAVPADGSTTAAARWIDGAALRVETGISLDLVVGPIDGDEVWGEVGLVRLRLRRGADPDGPDSLDVSGGPGVLGVSGGPGVLGVSGGPGVLGVSGGPGVLGVSGGPGVLGVSGGPGVLDGPGGPGVPDGPDGPTGTDGMGDPEGRSSPREDPPSGPWPERVAWDIGWWTVSAHRGRGVATAAARLLVRWAHQDVGLGPLVARIPPGHTPSEVVAARAGLVRRGRWDQDHDLWIVRREPVGRTRGPS